MVPPPDSVDMAPYEGYLQEALRYAGDTHTLDDIGQMVEDGRLQAWMGQRSILLTQIVDTPQVRCLHFFLAGGTLPEIQSLYPIVLQWGREQGCTRATCVGRRGWERTFLTREEGWTAPMVYLQKEL